MSASRLERRLCRLVAISLVAAFPLAVSQVRAAGTPPPATPTSATPDSASAAAAARQRAEALYRKAYKESEEAKAQQAKKPKDAAKKFAKALQRFDEATRLDPSYFEAWNMVGFCARKTGDLKRAFAAYDRALALRPDYEEAHEYLGEAYLASGDLAKAKEQLAWLEEKKSSEAEELREAIEAAEKGAPEHAGHEEGK